MAENVTIFVDFLCGQRHLFNNGVVSLVESICSRRSFFLAGLCWDDGNLTSGDAEDGFGLFEDCDDQVASFGLFGFILVFLVIREEFRRSYWSTE